MSLETKEIEVILRGKNIKHFEDLNYEVPRVKDNHYRLVVPKNTKILVKVEDLPKGSNIIVDVKCDYCGKVVPKKYYKYTKQKENSIINKDCCDECKQLKTKEGLLLKYGVERNTQIPKVKENMSISRRHNLETVRKLFLDKGLIIDENTFDYKNDRSIIYFTCSKHPEEGIQDTYYMILQQGGCGCKKCRYEKISGENCHMWKGGITDLYNYLRGKIGDWKFESLKSNNFKCVITNINDSSIIIHHLYSFAEIVRETLLETNIELYSKISMYSELELKILEDKCLELHYKYGLGVPILKCLHDIYHNTEGNLITDNIKFDNFKDNYYKGDFDYLLDSKYKSINILKTVS